MFANEGRAGYAAFAADALQADLRFKESLGIWQLPAFLVQRGRSAVLLGGVPRVRDMATAVERVLAAAECAGGGGRSTE